ncbi:hypothetical protein [Paenibacillus chondroitinus]
MLLGLTFYYYSQSQHLFMDMDEESGFEDEFKMIKILSRVLKSGQRSGVWNNFLTLTETGQMSILNKALGTYMPNTWYRVKAIIDQTGQKADVLLNDVQVVTGGAG